MKGERAHEPKMMSDDAKTMDQWLVKQWMSRNLRTVRSEDPVVDAFELMRLHRIRHLPVMKDGHLVGIISDRDVRHAIPLPVARSTKAWGACERALLETPVSKLMTRNPITIDPEAPIREAAEIVCREKIGALPVLEDGKLVGIVSAEDLLWAFVENGAGTRESLED